MTTNSGVACRGMAYDRLVRQEELILDVTERLTEVLLEQGITRAELARRLERSPGFVSQLLQGGRNLTLRTVADIAGALSLRPSLALSPLSKPAVTVDRWIPERRRTSTLPISVLQRSESPTSLAFAA